MPACLHFFFHSVSSWHARFMFLHVLAILPRSFSSSIPSTRSSSSWGSWFGSLFSSVLPPSLGIVPPHVHHILLSLFQPFSSFVFAFSPPTRLRCVPCVGGRSPFPRPFSLHPSVALPPQKGGIRIGLAHQGIFEASTPLSPSEKRDGWIRTNHTRLSPSLSPSDTHTHTLSLTHTNRHSRGRWRMADGGWRGRFTVGCVARPRGCGGRCTARRGEGVARVDPRTRETKVRLPRTPSS